MRSAGWVVHVMLLSVLLAAGMVAAAPITTLTVVIAPGVGQAPVYVGVARGIFEKYGLNVRVSNAVTGLAGITQVADGTAQVGSAAPGPIAQTAPAGSLKSIVAGWGDATGNVPTDDTLVIVARRTGGIREGHPEDLRGKKVGLPWGTDNHQYLLAVLAAKGLDPTTAVTIIRVQPPAMIGALKDGTVDAVVAALNASQVLQSVADAVAVQRGGNYIRFGNLQFASSRYLATHPGTLTRYVTAFAEAAQYVRLHPDDTVDVLSQYLKGVDRQTLRADLGRFRLDPRISRATARSAQEAYTFAMQIGALKQPPTFEQEFDVRILRQVERTHPELFKDLPPVPDAVKL
jgi:sulfonate transport system substrate-binding protein